MSVTLTRPRRSKKWLSLWLLIAMIGHFAFGHREASAFVLCFGADGHVAVERAGHDHALETGKRLPVPMRRCKAPAVRVWTFPWSTRTMATITPSVHRKTVWGMSAWSHWSLTSLH
jgi:hypothetical protein